MSQAGIVDIEGSHPQIPTTFVANVGTAVPIANTIEILGSAVAAHNMPLETIGSGNTISIEVQYASAAASSVANNAGVASFNSADFSVDANGYVSLSGSGSVESFQVDAATAPGTNPVVPNGSGIVTITGGQVAAGTTAHVIQTNSLAANTYTIQVQRSQAVASSTVGDNGVSHFNSSYFTVDANGFVSLNGSGVGETITGNTGGALSPSSGNWNILGASTLAGTIPVQTSGTGSTLTVQVQTAQAIASTNISNIGLAAFNSGQFTVDSNGFVSLSGSGVGETITTQDATVLHPSGGNWNWNGSGSLATTGSGSTATMSLIGLTAHAILVGAGTSTITKVGPTSTSGQILQSQGLSSDPAFSTATYPSTTTINQLLYSSAANTVGGLTAGNNGVLISSSSGVPSWLADGTTGQVLTATTGSPPSWANAASSSITITGDSGGGLTGNSFTFTGGSTGLTFSGSGTTETLTGTLVVANGGTGRASQTAYMPIVGGTTTTAAQQSVATGITGQVLQYQGASNIPIWASSILGSTTGSSPPSGYMGEVKIATFSGVSLASGGTNLTSLDLTAGNWILSGTLIANSGSAVQMSANIATSSGSLTPFATGAQMVTTMSTIASTCLSLPSFPLSLSGSATYYWNGMSGSSSGFAGNGYFVAIRIG